MKKIKKNCLYILLMCFISPIILAHKLDHYSTYFFPNKFDQGNNDASPLLPKNHAHIFSLPFLNAKKVLRVYFGPFVPIKDYLPSYNNKSIVELIKNGIWGDQFDAGGYKAYLFVYDPQRNSSVYLGVIQPESQDGNSGALYVPYAIRGDNKAIILDAWMGSPGAGGGSTDYGYALMPIRISSKNTAINSYILRAIATRKAVFYDHFSKVIYIDEGGKTAVCGKPGPTNDAIIYYRNLLYPTKKRILAEEPNTVYSNINVDEVNKKISFVATSYLNLPYATCPQDVYPQTLLKRKSIRQVMSLPSN
ncbi:hypothetical protein [Rickettsiella endosymbiont of Miltochrista miniata]|uniref:hypothetical protein n=1 Tax=Rickettsiella endosymbiont of Miltochrista miniata TaxID=3066239 RepID=UPI00313D9092